MTPYQQIIVALKQMLAMLIGKEPAKAVTMQYSPMVLRWAQLIAQEEGSKPRLNNPGNLKESTLTRSWGATEGFQATDGGWIAQFPTYQVGFDALCNFLTLGCEDELIAFHAPEARTLEGFTKIYAGNPPSAYITAIIAGLGVSGDTLISTFIGK